MDTEAIKIDRTAVIIAVLGLLIVGLILAIVSLDSRGQTEKLASSESGKTTVVNQEGGGFLGERGESLQAEGDKVYINEAKANDGNLHAFNYYSERAGKTIYFFIVRASDGTYRAAANACEVCFESLKGFRQVGGKILCENCRTTYSKDQIALQKGGCNPRPIDKDVEVVEGKLAINLADIEKTADLF